MSITGQIAGWMIASLLLAAVRVSGAQTADATTTPAPSVTPAPVPVPATVMVKLETGLGSMLLQIETQRAPITAANFLRYVDNKRLDGTEFYRAMIIGDDAELGLVQGGLRGNSRRVFKPIAHEPTTLTGLTHVSGAISMARAEPGTATADFFIVLGDFTALDARAEDPGYAVFGHLAEGMDVVRAILAQPRVEQAEVAVMKGQMLATPVKILSARRVP